MPIGVLSSYKSVNPLGVPADLQSAVKKVRPIKTGGFLIPQQKEKHAPLLRITNPQSLNRLGHFLTPDYKSGETQSYHSLRSFGKLRDNSLCHKTQDIRPLTSL